jgi:hypothetical protein
MPLDANTKMPVTGLSKMARKPLPKDVYQVELIDIESKMGKKFQSEEMEEKLSFTFAIIENTSFYGRKIWQNTNMKFSTGKKSTKLFEVVCALAEEEYTAKDCENPDFITADFLNSFIGKQLRLSIGQQPGATDPTVIFNTIDAYLPVKEQLPAYSEEKAKKVMAEQFEAAKTEAGPTTNVETDLPPLLQPDAQPEM